MKVYKTFAKCKLDNPKCDVYRSLYDNKFTPKAYSNYYVKCKPSNYLMHLVDFLDNGLEFTGGDTYLDVNGNVVTIKNPDVDNTPIYLDKDVYILEAKDLEGNTLYGVDSIKELDDPIMADIVKDSATKLAAKKDTALEVRQACRNLIETINKSELLPKAYELYCEFYGEEAVDFDDFEMREWNNKVWLHFAKKLQEVENEHQS